MIEKALVTFWNAATDSSPVQHSLLKQSGGTRRTQAEMGAADHSWRSERNTETWTFKNG